MRLTGGSPVADVDAAGVAAALDVLAFFGGRPGPRLTGDGVLPVAVAGDVDGTEDEPGSGASSSTSSSALRFFKFAAGDAEDMGDGEEGGNAARVLFVFPPI